jgi:superoxide dismutase, Cu-Zn family
MPTRCTCILTAESGSNVTGMLTLVQASDESPVVVTGELKGLVSGKHGITVNTYGDLSDGAQSCGPIFNPFTQHHGAPTDEARMVGSLGNILATEDAGTTVVQIVDPMIKLLGPHSIIGRSIVVYSAEDDAGRGGHALSLTTGNAGPRVCAGVVGLATSVVTM